MSVGLLNRTTFAPSVRGYNAASYAAISDFENSYSPPKAPFFASSAEHALGLNAIYYWGVANTLEAYKPAFLYSYDDHVINYGGSEMRTSFSAPKISSVLNEWEQICAVRPTQPACIFQVRLSEGSTFCFSAKRIFSGPLITIKSLYEETRISNEHLAPSLRISEATTTEVPLDPIPVLQEYDTRVEVLHAIGFAEELLSASDRHVAEALEISPSSIGHWKAGRTPRPSRAAKVFALRSLLKALVNRLGESEARAWLQLGSPVSRRDLILAGRMPDVQVQASATLFPLGPSPTGGYVPFGTAAERTRAGLNVHITRRRAAKVDISGRDR